MKPTILVTGGAGYIGSHISLLLAQRGYDVVILDNFAQGQTFEHPWALCINGDYGDKKVLEALCTAYNIYAVIHCASSIEVSESIQNPLAFYENNVANTIRLLQVMHAHNIKKIIFSSSCAVYGIPEIIPIPETHPQNPISPYGNTKKMIETILHDVHQAHGLQYVALRYFNAAGALPEHGLSEHHVPETHIIPLLLRAARTNKPFYIFGTDHPTADGTCIRDFLHVWDIAHAHLNALKHLEVGNPSDTFNLGTGRGISVAQMIDAVKQICNLEIITVPEKKRAGDPPILVADPSYAMNILAWQPRFSNIEFIIQTAYASEKGNSL